MQVPSKPPLVYYKSNTLTCIEIGWRVIQKNITFFFSLFFLQSNNVQIMSITFLHPPCSVSLDDPDSDVL